MTFLLQVCLHKASHPPHILHLRSPIHHHLKATHLQLPKVRLKAPQLQTLGEATLVPRPKLVEGPLCLFQLHEEPLHRRHVDQLVRAEAGRPRLPGTFDAVEQRLSVARSRQQVVLEHRVLGPLHPAR